MRTGDWFLVMAGIACAALIYFLWIATTHGHIL